MRTGALGCAIFMCMALVACGSGNDASDASRDEGRETMSGTFGEDGSGGSYSVREDGAETTLTVTDETGGDTVQVKSGGAAGVYLPEFAPLYPGAEVTPNIVGPDAGMFAGLGGAFSQNMGVDGADFKGGMVSFSTADSALDVVDFYKERASDAGLKTENDMNAGEMRVFAARDTATGRSMQIMIFPGNHEQPTQAMLVAGEEARP